jgi:hypothetical protein
MIQLWILGELDWTAEDEEERKMEWATRLVPNQSADAENEMWVDVTAARDRQTYGA